MTSKALFDRVSLSTSRLTTHAYSTSFSIGIRCLDKQLRDPIYSIYGFVRFADEIVDTFHDYNKSELFNRFREDTYRSIEEKISLNPILNSFQKTVHEYKIERELIETFLHSMEMDLTAKKFEAESFQNYVLGSAEVVGLMCLRVFISGNDALYHKLKPFAMKLGAAFQKINFLRDIAEDFQGLGRTYFPGLQVSRLDDTTKRQIEESIRPDFDKGFEGIRELPRSSRLGVYVAYLYYRALFKKIRNTPCDHVLTERIRIRNRQKISILCFSFVKHRLNLI
jgi:phytoene/squalene synthetase